jgi:hypothetical protein
MLASSGPIAAPAEDWAFEPKLDGWRALLYGNPAAQVTRRRRTASSEALTTRQSDGSVFAAIVTPRDRMTLVPRDVRPHRAGDLCGLPRVPPADARRERMPQQATVLTNYGSGTLVKTSML